MTVLVMSGGPSSTGTTAISAARWPAGMVTVPGNRQVNGLTEGRVVWWADDAHHGREIGRRRRLAGLHGDTNRVRERGSPAVVSGLGREGMRARRRVTPDQHERTVRG